MDNTAIIVLAAGLGSRMGQSIPKVLARTASGSLINHVLATACTLNPEHCIVVIGHQGESVQAEIESANHEFNNLSFAWQKEQLGTGHAVSMATPELKNFKGTVVILYGDVPLIQTKTLENLIAFHEEEKNTVSVLSLNDGNNHYGRIVRDENNQVKKIVEFKDCTAREKNISETNSGIYVVDSAFLIPAVDKLDNNNAQKEYYLTDIVEQAATEGQSLDALCINQAQEVQGVNTPSDLAKVNSYLSQLKIEALISEGVEFVLPESSYVDPTVEIAKGAKIGPNSQILGDTVIEEGVVLEGTNYLKNCEVGANTFIKLGCRIENSEIGNNCQIGPFANLRPESQIGSDCKIGNFVETKKVELADGVKAGHLSYLGDTRISNNTNIGAGTITCNYDGKNKHQTEIGADVFIGSNTALVAPIKIADGATIGAGSTISKDCLLYTSLSPRDKRQSRMPSSA